MQDVHVYAQEISPTEELTESNRSHLGQEASSKTADHSGNEDDKEAKENKKSLVVDQISRVVFPLIFIAFQAYYFGRYL